MYTNSCAGFFGTCHANSWNNVQWTQLHLAWKRCLGRQSHIYIYEIYHHPMNIPWIYLYFIISPYIRSISHEYAMNWPKSPTFPASALLGSLASLCARALSGWYLWHSGNETPCRCRGIKKGPQKWSKHPKMRTQHVDFGWFTAKKHWKI